ncbi:MAG: SH3 domain-containing protein [Candidatus Krumholzibacteriia bacterium]
MIRMLTILLALALLLTAVAWAAQQVSVQVRETQLRSGPSFLAGAGARLAYGARVTVLEERGPWVRVRDGQGRDGWLHRSAVAEQKVRRTGSGQDVAVTADSDELALAGKGFNEETERAYRDRNDQLDYAWVDRMEGWRVSADECARFLAAGQVGDAAAEVRP